MDVVKSVLQVIAGLVFLVVLAGLVVVMLGCLLILVWTRLPVPS